MTPDTRERLLATLREAEGRKPRAYRDSEGVWTVGYGHNLESGPPMSQRTMDSLLDDDLTFAEADCAALPWYADFDDVRQAVIAEMMYNLGPARFAGFRHMVAALAEGRFHEAADEMLDSKWARQLGPRARRLAAAMRTGTWHD